MFSKKHLLIPLIVLLIIPLVNAQCYLWIFGDTCGEYRDFWDSREKNPFLANLTDQDVFVELKDVKAGMTEGIMTFAFYNPFDTPQSLGIDKIWFQGKGKFNTEEIIYYEEQMVKCPTYKNVQQCIPTEINATSFESEACWDVPVISGEKDCLKIVPVVSKNFTIPANYAGDVIYKAYWDIGTKIKVDVIPKVFLHDSEMVGNKEFRRDDWTLWENGGDYWYVVGTTDDNVDLLYPNWTSTDSTHSLNEPTDIAWNGTYWYEGIVGASKIRIYYPNWTYAHDRVECEFDLSAQYGNFGGIEWNGSHFFIIDGAEGDTTVWVYDSGMNYVGESHDLSATTGTGGKGIALNETSWWILEASTDKVYEYNLDWTYASRSWSTPDGASSIEWNGTAWFVLNYDADTVYDYGANWVDTGYSISVAAQDNTPTAIYYLSNTTVTTAPTADDIEVFPSSSGADVHLLLRGVGSDAEGNDTALPEFWLELPNSTAASPQWLNLSWNYTTDVGWEVTHFIPYISTNVGTYNATFNLTDDGGLTSSTLEENAIFEMLASQNPVAADIEVIPTESNISVNLFVRGIGTDPDSANSTLSPELWMQYPNLTWTNLTYNYTANVGWEVTEYIYRNFDNIGTYNFTFNLTDNLGSSSSTLTEGGIFSINNTAPTAPTLNSPANNSITGNVTVQLNCSGSTDPDGDNITYYFYADTSNPPTTLLGNNATGLMDYTGNGNTFWRCRAYDRYFSDYSDTGFFQKQGARIYNVTLNHSTQIYETGLYRYSINVTANQWNVDDISAVLRFNGTDYTASRTNISSNADLINYEFYRSLNAPLMADSILSNLWNFTFDMDDGTTEYNDTHTFDVNLGEVEFGYCNSTFPQNISYINFTFKDETTDAYMNGSIRTSNFTYSLDSDRGIVKTYDYTNVSAEWDSHAFCFEPANQTIYADIDFDYFKGTDYPQRNYVQSKTLLNATDNVILYLVSSSTGIYVTFQVVNTAGQPIANVDIDIRRPVGGNTTIIESGTTGDDGGATFFLDPNYYHSITFTRTGYETYIFGITPTQSTYTITLETVSTLDENNYYQGISYDVEPSINTLSNQTSYNFNFTIASSYWSLEEAGFILTNETGILLDSASCTTSTGCTANTDYDTGLESIIIMEYYWIVDGNVTNSSKIWTVGKTSSFEASFVMFIRDFNKFSESFGSGRNADFTKALISFFIILMSIGAVTYISGIYSHLAILAEVFFLVSFLDLLGMIPNPVNAVPHFIPIILGILLLADVIYEYTK